MHERTKLPTTVFDIAWVLSGWRVHGLFISNLGALENVTVFVIILCTNLTFVRNDYCVYHESHKSVKHDVKTHNKLGKGIFHKQMLQSLRHIIFLYYGF